jgi:hypothetical protein
MARVKPKTPVNVGLDTGLRRLTMKKLIRIMDGMYKALMAPPYFMIICTLKFSIIVSIVK